MEVLAELGASDKRVLTVFNKVDLIQDDHTINALRRHFPEALFISTRTGEGLEELLARMADQLAGRSERVELLLPADRSDLLSTLHRHGQVLSTEYEVDGTRVHAVVPLKLLSQFAAFRQPNQHLAPVDVFVPSEPVLTGAEAA